MSKLRHGQTGSWYWFGFSSFLCFYGGTQQDQVLLGCSGPAGSVLSLGTGGFRWDDGRTQVLSSSEPVVVTFIKGAVVLNQ